MTTTLLHDYNATSLRVRRSSHVPETRALPLSVGMKDALHLAVRHAFGIGSSCASLHLLGLPDEHGSCKEHVIHTVGQHLALLRMDDGEMKVRFFTFAKL